MRKISKQEYNAIEALLALSHQRLHEAEELAEMIKKIAKEPASKWHCHDAVFCDAHIDSLLEKLELEVE